MSVIVVIVPVVAGVLPCGIGEVDLIFSLQELDTETFGDVP